MCWRKRQFGAVCECENTWGAWESDLHIEILWSDDGERCGISKGISTGVLNKKCLQTLLWIEEYAMKDIMTKALQAECHGNPILLSVEGKELDVALDGKIITELFMNKNKNKNSR